MTVPTPTSGIIDPRVLINVKVAINCRIFVQRTFLKSIFFLGETLRVCYQERCPSVWRTKRRRKRSPSAFATKIVALDHLRFSKLTTGRNPANSISDERYNTKRKFTILIHLSIIFWTFWRCLSIISKESSVGLYRVVRSLRRLYSWELRKSKV